MDQSASISTAYATTGQVWLASEAPVYSTPAPDANWQWDLGGSAEDHGLRALRDEAAAKFSRAVISAAKWQTFLECVRRVAPESAHIVDVTVDAVRPLLGYTWPLASLDLDHAVVVSWEDILPLYMHIELCDDGTGSWFVKRRDTGAYDGGEITSPETARDPLVTWLREQQRVGA